MDRALVFGGSGQLGFAVAKYLLDSGWSVDVVTHGGRPLSGLLQRGGARHIDAAGRPRGDIVKTARRPFDALFDPTCFDREDAADLIGAKARVASFCVVSTASVYADLRGRTLDEAGETGFPDFGGPIAEQNPTVRPGEGTYSERKVAMEDALLASGTTVSILRPCAVYGVLARHPREWWFVKRSMDGRPRVPIAFNSESRFHTSSANGLASLARLCFERCETCILNVADPEAPSVKEIAAAIGAALSYEFELVPFDGPPRAPAYAGSSPWSAARPFTLDTRRAVAFGWDGGGRYEEEVTEVCDWLRATARTSDWRQHFTKFLEYPRDPFDYEAEDALLAQCAD